jgi:hypothetical protein
MKKQTILYLFLIAISAISAQIPSYVPSNGLVAWWPFTGNAKDSSGNGNHGTVNGATLTTDRFGRNNQAYYFSSSGCATRIDANLNTTSIKTGLTFSYWFLQSGSGCIAPRTFEFGTGAYAPGFLQVQNWNTYNGVYYLSGSLQWIGLTCPSTPNNQWAHICFTVDKSIAK